MYWKPPHISKVYEALTAIADGRVIVDGNTAKVYSSSRGKYYDVVYDPASDCIGSNDNTAYFTGAMSYPMIAYFMLVGRVAYDVSVAQMLKGIPWKDINQKYKNNYNAAIQQVLAQLSGQGTDTTKITAEVERIYTVVSELRIRKFTTKKRPPRAY